MAPSAPVNPKPSVCPEKQRLSHAFLDALRQVMELQNQEIGMLARGGVGLTGFDLSLKRARANRDEAKRLYLFHLETHGC
jgi:hypothetical protein